MADSREILTAFRQHMVDAGLVRKPPDVDPGRHPMFVEPADGPWGPGPQEGLKPVEQDPLLAVSIFWGTGIPAGEADGYQLAGTIDVRFRSAGAAGAQAASALAAAMRAQLFEPNGQRKHGWVMGGLYVYTTGETSGFTRLASSRAEGFDDVWKAYVETRSG